jgi:hypothetical protein
MTIRVLDRIPLRPLDRSPRWAPRRAAEDAMREACDPNVALQLPSPYWRKSRSYPTRCSPTASRPTPAPGV